MITRFINYERDVRGLSARTYTEYEKELRAFAFWAKKRQLRWSTIAKQDIDLHVSEMHQRGLKASTIKKRVSALRGMFTWMVHENMLAKNPARWCQTPKLGERLPEATRIDLVDAYLEAPAKDEEDGMMHIAIALLIETGIRSCELIGLKTKDICNEKSSIKVRGKGEKERIVYFGRRTRKALRAYWHGQGNEIFPGWTTERLRWSMYKNAGTMIPRVHPHQLRHTFAMQALNNGMSLKALSQLLGHSNIATTEIYARATQKTLEAEYKAMSL